MKQLPLTRSGLARRSGVDAETIRFYEAQGLVPKPSRTAAGYRIYGDADVRRLDFIRRAQQLGFSLREIRDLIRLTDARRGRRSELRNRAMRKLSEIEQKVRDLQAMEKSLRQLVLECNGEGPIQGCPIFHFMSEGEHK